jgi:putative glutamine amidotransferase
MSPRPLVALTTSFEPRAAPHGRSMVKVWGAYIDALDRLGLAVVLLTPSHSPENLSALLENCAGLVLTGGGDVDPRRYGEQAIAGLDGVLPERDEMEFAALDFAIGRGLPILGICRGCQVLNVHLGGTLWQDIAGGSPGPIAHRQTGHWEERSHDVTIAPDSKLAAILGATAVRTNSFHHQAVRAAAPRLRVTATSGDGLAEAVELRDYPFCIAVQWHPERGDEAAPASDPDRRIFAAFHEAVLRYRDAVRAPG